MNKLLLITLIVFCIVGCSTTPIRNIQYVAHGNYVIAAKTKSVEVHAKRIPPKATRHGVWIDRWVIRLVNTHATQDWCASVNWRQVDYNIHVPNQWFYLSPGQYLHFGYAIQESWKLSKAEVTFNDAAFSVYRLNLIKPIDGKCIISNK